MVRRIVPSPPTETMKSTFSLSISATLLPCLPIRGARSSSTKTSTPLPSDSILWMSVWTSRTGSGCCRETKPILIAATSYQPEQLRVAQAV
ncbi:MAG: hypothetical protein BWY13_00222 [Euryarchaeota archaeon ADurb.Bin190]|nr:MAG: hypothetical protein BWY13_00222 [Euryarchaeota archaeon ADurb.Bin190]